MKKNIDPLYIIFEKKLFDTQNVKEEDFAFSVVREYLDLIKDKQIVIPDVFFDETIETLIEEVKLMLVKKIYGYPGIKEYQESNTHKKVLDIELARQRYYKLKKSA